MYVYVLNWNRGRSRFYTYQL